MADVDWNNPCQRAEALRTAYHERLTGGTSTRVRFRSGDSEQEVQSTFPGGSLAELRNAMRDAEDECRKSQGLPPLRRRFAIRPA
jgi:hypothetical protein